MRSLVTMSLLLLLCTSPMLAQQSAASCAVGPGVGATLLFPYFEVDLANSQGVTTLLSINNATLSPKLARMTVWTNWAVPTIAFDIYLDPRDIQTINMRSILSGNLPSTGAGADLDSFANCDAFPPDHLNPILFDDEINQLQADHRGLEGILFTECGGEAIGDQIARGYITVDVVDECNGVEGSAPIITPDNSGLPYFADGNSVGVATNENALWGDLIYVDFQNNSSQGSEAVAIWADASQLSGADTFTFYGRYSNWDGSDNRVPLPDLWTQRFLNGGAFDGGADLLVWRDTNSTPEFADCGNVPSWNPLGSELIAFDEDGSNAVTLSSVALPLATQRIPVSGLGIPYDFGQLELDTEFSQTWVQPTLAAGGLFSAAFNGTPLLRLCGESPSEGTPVSRPAKANAQRRIGKDATSLTEGAQLRGRRPARSSVER